MQAGLTTRPLTLSEIFPPATLLWVSEAVRSGQSTVLVIVDDADDAGGMTTIDDGSTEFLRSTGLELHIHHATRGTNSAFSGTTSMVAACVCA
jgi:hypothetical protein